MNNLIVMPLTRKKRTKIYTALAAMYGWLNITLSCHLNSVGHEQKLRSQDICEKACKNKSTA